MEEVKEKLKELINFIVYEYFDGPDMIRNIFGDKIIKKDLIESFIANEEDEFREYGSNLKEYVKAKWKTVLYLKEAIELLENVKSRSERIAIGLYDKV